MMMDLEMFYDASKAQPGMTYPCQSCGFGTDSREVMIQHWYRHERGFRPGEHPGIYCVVCTTERNPVQFPSLEDASVHFQKAHDHKIFLCRFCDREFHQNSLRQYQKHVRRHTEGPRYVRVHYRSICSSGVPN